MAELTAVAGPAGEQSAEPDGIGVRRLSYLTGITARVVGDGPVVTVAAGVLSALGATVEQAEDEPGLPWEGSWDVVICDRVEVGADDGYLSLVDRELRADPPAARHCWVTASAFGLSGPARSYRGSELVCAAAGGMLAAVHDSQGRFFQIAGEQALQSVGYAAALAALHGISLSRGQGAPVHLDLSAQEAVAFITNQQTPSHVLHKCGVGVGAGRYSAPSNPFPTRDGYIEIIVVDNHQFSAFCEAMGRPEWIEFFPQVADRVAAAEMIDEVVAEWSSGWAKDELEEYLQSRGISATAVRPASEVAATALFRGRRWEPAAPGEPGVVVPALITGAAGDGHPRPESPVLADLHVLESSNVLAGPLTGAILGALGAEVVRVEPTGRMDLYRQNGPFAGGIAGIERGAYFMGANYSKGSVTEGVARPLGEGALRWADAVIENTGRKRLEQLGIAPGPPGSGHDQVSLSISAFGRTGPGGTWRGYAPNVHALAGIEDAVVAVAGRPVTIRTVMADYASATWAATLVAAWWLSGGQGSYAIDLSMAEVTAGRMVTGRPARPDPGGVIIELAGGGHLAVSGTAGHPWPAAAAQALGEDSPEAVSAETAQELLRTRAQADPHGTVAVLQAAGIAAYVAPGPEILAEDPQLADRGFFVRQPHPVIGTAFSMAVPWTVAGVPRGGWYRRAPLLGEQDDWARQAWGSGSGDGAGAGPAAGSAARAD